MTHTIDITKEHCPMTMVKVKVALAKLAPGEVLEVTLSQGEPLDNVPRTAREQGHEIVEIAPHGEFHRVVIRKGV